MTTLYSFYLSSASLRVRLALAYKGIDHQLIEIDLASGRHKEAGYSQLNPQALVPTLVDGAATLTQSTAIIEYLEERYEDTPPLLPRDPVARATVRSTCQFIASEMQPLTNARIRAYMGQRAALADEAKRWCMHWTLEGLQVLENTLVQNAGAHAYCHGSEPTMADAFLAPQLFLARRFLPDLNGYPRLSALEQTIRQTAGFKNILDQAYSHL